MAERRGAVIRITPSRAPASLALAFVLACLGAGFLPVLGLGLSAGLLGLDAYFIRVLIFTFVQAGLSTAISLVLGLALARALARQQFIGRTLLLRLLNLPLALPAIVVIIGVIDVYGAKGWLGGWFDLYGLQGILIAHVFFNLPLAVRLCLSELERIPGESWKLAAQLNFNTTDIWRLIEWPQLRGALPGIGLLIFLLCASSFAIVLTLGGGPRATTLEVAIYQALRADFDPARAASLALAQLALCTGLVLIAQRFGGLTEAMPRLRMSLIRYDGKTPMSRLIDGGTIFIGLLILLPPLAGLVFSGTLSIRLTTTLVQALATSFALGSASAALTLALIWPLANAAARSPGWRAITRLVVVSAWILPPAVLATGWFIGLTRLANVSALAPLLVITMNALMALPFAHQALAPALAEAAQRHDRLCASLSVSGWNRLRLIDLPALRRPIGLALAMALIVSLGDLTAIALFGTQDLVTMPALIYRQMGSYRFDEAIGSALVLALCVLLLTTLSERWSVPRDQA